MNLNIDQLKYLDNISKQDTLLSVYARQALLWDSISMCENVQKEELKLNNIIIDYLKREYNKV